MAAAVAVSPFNREQLGQQEGDVKPGEGRCDTRRHTLLR